MSKRDPLVDLWSDEEEGLDEWRKDSLASHMFGMSREEAVRRFDEPLPRLTIRSRIRGAWRGLVAGWKDAL